MVKEVCSFGKPLLPEIAQTLDHVKRFEKPVELRHIVAAVSELVAKAN